MKSWSLSPELRFKVILVFMKTAKVQLSLGLSGQHEYVMLSH